MARLKLHRRLWRAVKEFANHTSVHGLRTAVNGNFTCRIIWSIIFIGSFSLCMYLVACAILKLLRYEVLTTVKLSNAAFPFPAVTICNLNPFKKSLFGNVTEFAYLDNAMQSAANRQTTSPSELKRKKRTIDVKFENIAIDKPRTKRASDPSCNGIVLYGGRSPNDCEEIKLADSSATSGVYKIEMPHCTLSACCVQVYCDMVSFGGGWLEFQRRLDGTVDFYRTNSEYTVGFGSAAGEYWLGNQYLHALTSGGENYELLVELKPFEVACSVHARYSMFDIGSSSGNYVLTIGGFSSPTIVPSGNSMASLNGRPFRTKDTADTSCATLFMGGWWYGINGDCHEANLNGLYNQSCGCTGGVFAKHLTWGYDFGYYYTFQQTKMKMRPRSSSLNAADVQCRYCTSITYMSPLCSASYFPCPATTTGTTCITTTAPSTTTTGTTTTAMAGTTTNPSCASLVTFGSGPPRNCEDIMLANPGATSGVYTIKLTNCSLTPVCCVQVYCDMQSFGGGWLEFQRRIDGSVDFYRTYNEYANGFGTPSSEYWLGNSYLSMLTNSANYELLIELKPYELNCSLYARYAHFSLGSSSTFFQLNISGFSSPLLNDSFKLHNGHAFSAQDADHDVNAGGNCATFYKGGWWYHNCHCANLNGLYKATCGCTGQYGTHMSWCDSFGWYYTFQQSKMKIRPYASSLDAPDHECHFCTSMSIETRCDQNSVTCGPNMTGASCIPPVYCQDFFFVGGYVVYDSGTANFRPEGTTALLSCNGTAIVSGSVFAECMHTGTWQYPGANPECIAVPAAIYAQMIAAQGDIQQYFNNPQALQELLQEYMGYFTANIDEDTLRSMGHPFPELVPGCSYNGVQCGESDFTSYIDAGFGNCYQFNNDARKYSLANAGPVHGLSLNFFVNQSEYTSLTERAGVAIVLHGQQETVIADSMANVVPLGYETFLTATYSTMTKLGWPYGDCIESADNSVDFYYKTKYSQEGCYRSCYQKDLIESCNCGDPRLPLPSGKRYCTALQKSCVKDFSSTHTADYLSSKCYCPLACRDTRYAVTISQSSWPAKTNLPKPCWNLSNLHTSACLIDYRKNYGKINIFLRTVDFESVVESPAYDIVSLLSDFGGLFGLYLGLSVISFAEFVVLAGQLFRYGLQFNMDDDNDDEEMGSKKPSTMCF